MGVSIYNIIMLGVRLDCTVIKDYEEVEEYDILHNDKYNPKKCGSYNNIGIIEDGMCGEYLLVGYPIFISGVARWFEDETIPLTELPKIDDKKVNEIKKFLKEKFNINKEVGYIVVSHHA